MFKLISKVAFVSLAAARSVWIDPEDRVIRDKDQRHVLFHGVNVVYKVAPYIPESDIYDSQSSMTDKDIQDLKDWGFNFVRLGVMWEAVETAPGVYNDTYLEEIDKLITKLGNQGIYTLVDAHQDVLAR
jgi:endoglycosylceramidase